MVEQHLTSWNQRSVISPASTIVIDLDASLQGWRATVRELGPLSMDLFASRLSNQLPKFVSWKPDPLAMATNAFTLTWSDLSQKVYANPPWNLIGRVLSKVCNQSILELILIAPVWKAQAWYPLLLQRLVRVPILFPMSSEMVQSVSELPPRHLTPTSRVGNIRKRCQRSHLSGTAADLVLSSWREKSSKSCESSFQKWASWCNEQDRDPICGPISDVANFLAELYEVGYQYRSINSYYSSIPTTHENVDGHPVGQ